jgi:putative spermidine/putrescine transport system permease protein
MTMSVVSIGSPVPRLGQAPARTNKVLVPLLLVLPALALVLSILIGPSFAFLGQAVTTDEARVALPRTTAALADWSSHELPPAAATAALAADLRAASSPDLIAAARRLNTVEAGFRNLLVRTRDHLAAEPLLTADLPTLVRIDQRWGDSESWAILKTETRMMTPTFLLAAIDRRLTSEGAIGPLPPDRAIYLDILARTVWISATVTLACLLLGFPVAFALSQAPPRRANILLVFILLPLWTSALVRSAAWVVLLQREGLVNQALIGAGLLDEPAALVFNRIGVIIAMTHVQLPLLILPLYSTMKAVPQDLMRAAAMLGAGPIHRFIRIYIPQIRAGLIGGVLLVFTVSLGYYITPALVGGPSDQMISAFIALYTNQTLNWGMGAALSLVLIACVGVLFAAVGRRQGLAIVEGR